MESRRGVVLDAPPPCLKHEKITVMIAGSVGTTTQQGKKNTPLPVYTNATEIYSCWMAHTNCLPHTTAAKYAPTSGADIPCASQRNETLLRYFDGDQKRTDNQHPPAGDDANLTKTKQKRIKNTAPGT